MTRPDPISRRRILALMASAFSLAIPPTVRADENPSDRGIGGTGISAAPSAPMTQSVGFVGTIQRFGSIYVNDVRITYPKDMKIRLDGREANTSQLKIGQVVRVVSRDEDDRFLARQIDIVSEVIGPIDAISPDGMTVLGQTVLTDPIERPRWWQSGVRVAVSGIRRTDGVIVASLVERAGSRPDQIVGVATMQGWNLQIGGQQLLGVHESFGGHRIIVQGRTSRRGFMVSRARVDLPFQGTDVDHIFYETYVSQDGPDLRTGSGVEFRGLSLGNSLGDGRSFRAVLDVAVDRGGGMRLDGVSIEAAKPRHLDGRTRSFGRATQPSGPGALGRQPFGSGPGGAGSSRFGPGATNAHGGLAGNSPASTGSLGPGGSGPAGPGPGGGAFGPSRGL